ncbi:MAG: tol-pal system-associated acyl-CoA thioesterase [Alphaproteobacteria bacterium]|nr:tol-pal system-associated acyl-CoA thioesterase [Alphaproteobacteria bacterium]
MALRVYWEDTDASGIVYYANYLRFVERARSDLLRLLGVNQQRLLEEQGLALAVRACALEYLRPARLDDEIEVHSSIAEMRGASLTARQVVRRGEEELVQADVRIACIDRAGRPRRLPAQVVAALRPVAGQ